MCRCFRIPNIICSFICTYFRLSLEGNNELRIRLGAAHSLETFKSITIEIKDKYEPYHLGKLTWSETVEPTTQNLILPPWLCQPYVRIQPEEHIKLVEDKQKLFDVNKTEKRQYEDAEGNRISRKRMKKLRRINRRPEKPESVSRCPKSLNLCSATACVNPLVSVCFINYLVV